MPDIRGLGAGGQGEINSRLGILGKKCEASQQLGVLPYRPVGKKSRGGGCCSGCWLLLPP